MTLTRFGAFSDARAACGAACRALKKASSWSRPFRWFPGWILKIICLPKPFQIQLITHFYSFPVPLLQFLCTFLHDTIQKSPIGPKAAVFPRWLARLPPAGSSQSFAHFLPAAWQWGEASPGPRPPVERGELVAVGERAFLEGPLPLLQATTSTAIGHPMVRL